MRSRTAYGWSVGLLCGVGLAVTCGLRAQDGATPGQQLQAKLEERRDTLKSRVKALETRLEVGVGDIDLVCKARIDLLDAELQLADTKARRIELLKSRVEKFQQLEKTAKVRQGAPPPPPQPGRPPGVIDSTDQLYLAMAARMQAEIDLLREQAAP